MVLTKEDVRVCLTYALEVRRRVKEQLKKLGGLEFFDVNFSYIDNDSLEEFFVSVPEQGGSELIPAGMPKPGVVHLVTQADSGMTGLYRFETQMMAEMVNMPFQAWDRIQQRKKLFALVSTISKAT
jgi:ATP-dependent Lon protease